MAHEFAGAFQQVLRISEFGAEKEADVDVMGEGIDLCERGFADACGRVAVVQQFGDVRSATAHDIEPALRDGAQRPRMILHPEINGGVATDRGGKQHQSSAHSTSSRAATKLPLPRRV